MIWTGGNDAGPDQGRVKPMDENRLEEVQTALKTIHDEIEVQLGKAAAIGREILEAEPSAGPFEPLTATRFVAEELRGIEPESTLVEYMAQLRKLSEMLPEDIRRQGNAYRWQQLIDVSNRASRGLSEISDLLSRACSDENAVGLASLLRGVRQASSDYVVLAERLEAHARADLGLTVEEPS
jgi:hypothetical protein